MILIFNQNLLVQSNVLQTEKTISLIELIQSSGTAGQIIISLLFISLVIFHISQSFKFWKLTDCRNIYVKSTSK